MLYYHSRRLRRRRNYRSANDHPGQSVIPQAKFALARLFEAQNKPEPARNLFEDVYRSNPYDSLGSEAGMRLEELRMKYPALFPTAPSPTNNMPITLEKP